MPLQCGPAAVLGGGRCQPGRGAGCGGRFGPSCRWQVRLHSACLFPTSVASSPSPELWPCAQCHGALNPTRVRRDMQGRGCPGQIPPWEVWSVETLSSHPQPLIPIPCGLRLSQKHAQQAWFWESLKPHGMNLGKALA